jgi:hypothetical protein
MGGSVVILGGVVYPIPHHYHCRTLTLSYRISPQSHQSYPPYITSHTNRDPNLCTHTHTHTRPNLHRHPTFTLTHILIPIPIPIPRSPSLSPTQTPTSHFSPTPTQPKYIPGKSPKARENSPLPPKCCMCTSKQGRNSCALYLQASSFSPWGEVLNSALTLRCYVQLSSARLGIYSAVWYVSCSTSTSLHLLHLFLS